jgi:hypothetical protein
MQLSAQLIGFHHFNRPLPSRAAWPRPILGQGWNAGTAPGDHPADDELQ